MNNTDHFTYRCKTMDENNEPIYCNITFYKTKYSIYNRCKIKIYDSKLRYFNRNIGKSFDYYVKLKNENKIYLQYHYYEGDLCISIEKHENENDYVYYSIYENKYDDEHLLSLQQEQKQLEEQFKEQFNELNKKMEYLKTKYEFDDLS